jgi:hypothetical protein
VEVIGCVDARWHDFTRGCDGDNDGGSRGDSISAGSLYAEDGGKKGRVALLPTLKDDEIDNERAFEGELAVPAREGNDEGYILMFSGSGSSLLPFFHPA